MIEPIETSITVGCPPATAFDIFTKEIAAWWPLDRNSVSAMSGDTARTLVLEPHVGGAVYEVKVDGTREDWAHVVAFVPGEMLQLAWHVLSPADQATAVTIRFVAAGGGTRVELTHTGWEIMGADAATRRKGYAGGWVHVFETCFAKACAQAA